MNWEAEKLLNCASCLQPGFLSTLPQPDLFPTFRATGSSPCSRSAPSPQTLTPDSGSCHQLGCQHECGALRGPRPRQSPSSPFCISSLMDTASSHGYQCFPAAVPCVSLLSLPVVLPVVELSHNGHCVFLQLLLPHSCNRYQAAATCIILVPFSPALMKN